MVSSMNDAMNSLNRLWETRAPDDLVAIAFLTHFQSVEVTLKAMGELSFVEASGSSIKTPNRIQAMPAILEDLDDVVEMILVGQFTRSEAQEVVTKFSKHVDHVMNKKRLHEVGASLALELQEQGRGGVIWTTWPLA